MTNLNCEYVRDVYPDVLHGEVNASLGQSVRAHIAACTECRAEVALLEALLARSEELPAGLHERVMRNARRPRSRWHMSRGAVAMAATLAAALLGGTMIMQTQRERASERATATEAPLGFVSVEGIMLSGKVSLDDLSVEELETLLGEMES